MLIFTYAFLDGLLFFCCSEALSFCFCNEDVTIYDITLISMATDCKVNNILHLHCRISGEGDGSCWNRDMWNNPSREDRKYLGRGCFGAWIFVLFCFPQMINLIFKRSSKNKQVKSCITSFGQTGCHHFFPGCSSQCQLVAVGVILSSVFY